MSVFGVYIVCFVNIYIAAPKYHSAGKIAGCVSRLIADFDFFNCWGFFGRVLSYLQSVSDNVFSIIVIRNSLVVIKVSFK
ncbi:hypothetical protein D3C81_1768380 [compost metagenome]